jgi:hypothetical protein
MITSMPSVRKTSSKPALNFEDAIASALEDPGPQHQTQPSESHPSPHSP